MSGTAVGTGLNTEPKYIKAVARQLSALTREMFITARNLIDMTNNTDAFADFPSSMKEAALVLIVAALTKCFYIIFLYQQ